MDVRGQRHLAEVVEQSVDAAMGQGGDNAATVGGGGADHQHVTPGGILQQGLGRYAATGSDQRLGHRGGAGRDHQHLHTSAGRLAQVHAGRRHARLVDDDVTGAQQVRQVPHPPVGDFAAAGTVDEQPASWRGSTGSCATASGGSR